ncbi:hypothetical protein ACFL6U_24915 [Planctomycetota bacterium]
MAGLKAVLVTFILMNVIGGILEGIQINREGDSNIGSIFFFLSFIVSPIAGVCGGIGVALIGKRRELSSTYKNTDQEKSPSQHQRKNVILILINAASVFFLIFCIVSISVVITLNTQSTPKGAILRHPNKVMVPAGLTKNDLEEAEKRIKQYAKSYVRDAVRGAMSGDMSGEMDQTVQSLDSVGELFINEHIVTIPNETRCSILKSSFRVCKVRIENGPRIDKIYWVYKKHLVRSD